MNETDGPTASLNTPRQRSSGQTVWDCGFFAILPSEMRNVPMLALKAADPEVNVPLAQSPNERARTLPGILPGP